MRIARPQALHHMQALQHLADITPQRTQVLRATAGLKPLPQHVGTTMRWPHKTAQGAQQSGFAGTVGADDGQTLTGAHEQMVDLKQAALTGLADEPVHGDHSSARLMRALIASKSETNAMTTSRMVASRPH